MALKYLFLYLCVVNSIEFLLYGYDKRQAIKDKRRISEKTLHLWMFLGGSIGAFFGQRVFRHKTIKGSLQFVFWSLIILQLGILIFIWKH